VTCAEVTHLTLKCSVPQTHARSMSLLPSKLIRPMPFQTIRIVPVTYHCPRSTSPVAYLHLCLCFRFSAARPFGRVFSDGLWVPAAGHPGGRSASGQPATTAPAPSEAELNCTDSFTLPGGRLPQRRIASGKDLDESFWVWKHTLIVLNLRSSGANLHPGSGNRVQLHEFQVCEKPAE